MSWLKVPTSLLDMNWLVRCVLPTSGAPSMSTVYLERSFKFNVNNEKSTTYVLNGVCCQIISCKLISSHLGVQMELFLELMASSSSVLDRRLERPECTEWLRLNVRV